MYLPPDETAALILQYDGTTENLPQLVVRFDARQDGSDYIVDTYAYAEVPQKSGRVVRLNQMTGKAKRRLEKIYVAAGAAPKT